LASYLACRLPAAEAEAIEQHLYTCPDCVDTVRSLESQDRFFGALLKPSAVDSADEPSTAEIVRLKEKLMALVNKHEGPIMIAFSCPSCGKKLQVKEELAGKRVRCPGCANVAAVPAADPAVTAASSGSAPAVKERVPGSDHRAHICRKSFARWQDGCLVAKPRVMVPGYPHWKKQGG